MIGTSPSGGSADGRTVRTPAGMSAFPHVGSRMPAGPAGDRGRAAPLPFPELPGEIGRTGVGDRDLAGRRLAEVDRGLDLRGREARHRRVEDRVDDEGVAVGDDHLDLVSDVAFDVNASV